MARGEFKSGIARFYAEHAGAAGVVFCILPNVVFWIVMLAGYWEFRAVYVARFAVTLLLGGAVAGAANRYGVALCLTKHASPDGPATVKDGLAIGAAVGLATGLVGPLTGLIATNHPDTVKNILIITWSSSAVLGALIGGFLASRLAAPPKPAIAAP